MTQDEIIRMAKEVGFVEDTNYEIYGSYYHLERFAALVAAHERKKQTEHEPVAWIEIERGIPMFVKFADKYKPNCDGFIPLYAAPVSIEAAVLAEREACAKVCENDMGWLDNGGGELCAKAIRARS